MIIRIRKTSLCIIHIFFCFLILWPGMAEETSTEIQITTTSDQVNGDVSNISALKAYPGPDGISLREAIIASNTTTEQKNIVFSEGLYGKTISIGKEPNDPRALPSLTSGHFRINGDINGDKKPDITLNGKYFDIPSMEVGPSYYHPTHDFSGININSSFVTLEFIKITNFPHGGIVISAVHDLGSVNEKIKKITINGCIISKCGSGINIQPPSLPTRRWDDMSNLSWSEIKITNNIIKDIYEIDGIVLGPGAGNDTFRNVRIEGNTLTNCFQHGIGICAADTSSYWHDPTLRPIKYSDNNSIINVKILNNKIKNSGWSICISCSNYDNRNNLIKRIIIKNNTIDGDINGVDGININVCGHFGEIRTMQNNVIDDIKIINNKIRNNSRWGIRIESGILPEKGYKGRPFYYNMLKNVVIKKNLIEKYANAGFYILLANSGSHNKITDLSIEQNTIGDPLEDYALGLICYLGIANVKRKKCLEGVNAKKNKMKSFILRENHFHKNQTAMHLIGGWGIGANYNKMTVTIEDNIFTSNIEDLIIQENVGGAKGNIILIDNYSNLSSSLFFCLNIVKNNLCYFSFQKSCFFPEK